MKKITMFISSVVFSIHSFAIADTNCLNAVTETQASSAYSWHFGLSPVPPTANAEKQSCLRSIRESAQANSRDAQIALADIYYYGKLGVASPKKALYWYKRASYGDSAYASYRIGQFYERGLVVDSDLSESIWWYAAAAVQNYAPAQLKLAEFHRHGKGVKANNAKATHWYRLAANNGDITAQYQLGHYLMSGKESKSEAYAWLSVAAEQGAWFSKLYRNQIMRKMTKVEQQEGQQLFQALNTNLQDKYNSVVATT